MKIEDIVLKVATILTVVSVSLVPCVMGFSLGRNDVQDDAINRGYAHYEVVSRNRTQFVWGEEVEKCSHVSNVGVSPK